jgi:hypothetical protein
MLSEQQKNSGFRRMTSRDEQCSERCVSIRKSTARSSTAHPSGIFLTEPTFVERIEVFEFSRFRPS